MDNNENNEMRPQFQTITTFPKVTSNFDLGNADDYTRVLVDCYRESMRGRETETDTDTITERARAVIEWMMQGKKWGLLICGSVGTGKTTMLKAIFKMLDEHRHCLRGNFYVGVMGWNSAIEITNECIHHYNLYESDASRTYLGIDDLGQEPEEINIFGSITHPLRDILLDRYERNQITIITSNLTPRDITERYGERVGDRLHEMMQVILFNGQSYRK